MLEGKSKIFKFIEQHLLFPHGERIMIFAKQRRLSRTCGQHRVYSCR